MKKEMPKKIDIKGDIISNDYAWIYDWMEWEYTSPGKVQKELEDANKVDVEFQINSPGGDVFAGYEIYNMIKNYEGHTTSNIVGLAASCGSFIPMASEKVISQPMAMMMIHGASTSTRGNQQNHEHTRDFLSKVDNTIVKAYTSRNGKTDEEMLDLMEKETWFTAEEMLEMGLIDEIVGQEGNKPNLKAYNSTEDIQKRELIDKIANLGNVENLKQAILEGKINLNLGQKVTNSATIDSKPNEKEEEKEMTLDQFKSEHADLYNQIVNSAKTEEKERINAINALRGKVPQDMLDKGIEEGKTAQDVAYAAMMAQPIINAQAEKEIKADAEESGVNNVGGTSMPVNTDEQEEKSALSNMAKFMNGGRK